MCVLESNKKILQAKYPEIWKKLESYLKENAQDLEEEVIECAFVNSRENASAVVVHKGEESIRLNSQYYPLREAKKWASQFEYHNISAHAILYGLGNGLMARELLANLMSDNCLVIIEPDFRIFAQVICHVDISEVIGHERAVMFFYKYEQEKIKKQLSSLITWGSLPTLIRCEHPGYRKLDEGQYKEYNTMVESLYEKAHVSRDTNAFYANIVIPNIINSLQYIQESNYISELVERFPENYPAVVVSAGPSLSKNGKLIRKMKNRAFILVVDTAVKVMEEQHLPYDAIVLIDPVKPADFITKYPGSKDKPLFCLTESQAEILNFHCGRKIWLPNAKWLEKTYAKFGLAFPKHELGGSVATMATEAARIVGCKTIILVGQDLAYLGGQTHAGREKPMGEERKYRSQWVDGIDGTQVRSRWDWIQFIHWFEEFIKRNEDITLADATEGGALIHGSEVLTLEEAIDRYCRESFSFDDFLKALPYTFSTYDYAPMKAEILKLKSDTEETLNYAAAGKRYISDFHAQEKEASIALLQGILTKCMNLNANFAKVSGYELIELGSSEMLRDSLNEVNQLSGDALVDCKNTAKMLEAYYQAVTKTAKDILREMDAVLDKMGIND